MCSSFCGVQVMEDRWIERLLDSPAPIGTCFLREYARAMRLLSGLCTKGFLRCLARSRNTRMDESSRIDLMAHRSVQDFIKFLREFPQDQVPMIFEVISQELFPDHAGGSLFQAGATDPLLSPTLARQSAVRDLRVAEALLPQVTPSFAESPPTWSFGLWDSDAYTDVTTGIGRSSNDESVTTFPEDFWLPSTIAGFGGPGQSALVFPQESQVQIVVPDIPPARVREKRRRRRETEEHPRDVETAPPEENVERVMDPPPPGNEVQSEGRSHPPEPEYEEVPVEAEGPPALVGVPEPKLPPKPKIPVPEPEFPPGHKRPKSGDAPESSKAADTQPKRSRKSRWDPEERPGTLATGSMFQLGFSPPSGLPTSVVPMVTKLVASIQVILRASPRADVDAVVTKDDIDPMLLSKISDFGQVLRQYSLHSRLSLLSYGKAWKLKLIDHEVSSTVVTLFLHAELLSQVPPNPLETQPKRQGRPPRSRSPYKKPDSDSKASGSGHAGPKAVGAQPTRPVFSSHGSKRRAAAADGPSSSSSYSEPDVVLTVNSTVADTLSVSPEAALLPAPVVAPETVEVSPTIPFDVQVPNGADHAHDVPPVIDSGPVANVSGPQAPRLSNWFHYPSDGRRHCNSDWFQVQSSAVQAVLRGGDVSDVLSAIRELPFHPLGGFHGCTLVGPNCRVQVGTHAIAPEARSARAYKVSPVCVYCQEVVPLESPIFECPSCHGDLGSFRLPNAHFSQLRGTQKIVDQIRPHHAELGTRSGFFNLSFRIKQIFDGFWLVIGPDDVEFWVLLPWDVSSLVNPVIDQPYYLYQAICVGTVSGRFIVRAPSPRETGALIRQHTPQDSPRTLELFSGIGGWHQALQAIQSQDVPTTSVEINPIPARAMARSTGRPCVTVSEWLTTPLLQDFILNGDFKDPTWWATTLIHPFSQVCFSAPCVPWSTAGCRRGLHDDDGLLLIHVAVLLVLFQVDFAVGENVPGLVSHPHWNQVKQVFESIGLHLDVRLHDLASFGIMRRNRSFMTLTKTPVLWPDFQCIQELDFTGILLERWDRSRTQVPLASIPLLSTKRLLPSNLLQKAYERGLEDGPAILDLRVHQSGPLPTIVASYRNQTQLAAKHLEEKGLYTWLIDPSCPRFLDPFEGARALGFTHSLVLPQDLDQAQAMKCVGNSLSPIQALLALFAVLPDDQKTSSEHFQNVLQTWLTGLRRMSDFRVLSFGDHSHLVLRSFIRPHVIERFHASVGSCDGQVFPVNLSASFARDDSTNAQAWPLGPPWTIQEVGRHFTEDTLLLVLRIAAARILFSRMGVPKSCLLSPFTRLRQVTEVLRIPSLLLKDADLPLWMQMSETDLECGDASLTLRWDDDEVFFSAGQDVRVWRYTADTNFAQVADLLFPHCAQNGVHVQRASDLEFVEVSQFPVPGKSYRFYFQPIRVRVEPYGYFAVDPLASVDQLAHAVNIKQFRGRAHVHVCINGRITPRDVSAVLANQLGVLRARVYALPGGAWTLNTVQEELQTLLVQHGHPASDVGDKANLLIDKFGAKQCKAWLDSKHPWATFKTEASKVKLALIPLDARGSAKSSQGLPDLEDDPWRNWKKNPVDKPLEPKRKKVEKRQSLSTKIDHSFFHIEGAEAQPLELHQLLQGNPGLHVTTLQDFQQHLDTVLTANVCLGAAGVLLVGATASEVAGTSVDRVQDVIVPGWLGSHAAALIAALIQVGDAPLSTHSINALTVQQVQSPHQVVQFHVYRNECDKWDLLTSEGFEPFLKHLGFVHLSAVNQMWACDFFSRGKRVAPEQAVYYHGFVKLDLNKVDTLLKMGGISGFYPSPRSATRGADPRFRSILMRGLSLPEARKFQATVPTALGLTRTRQGLGLRVLTSEYASIKKKLFPQALESSDSDEGGARKFQLLGIPKDMTRSSVKLTLKALNWQARVSKACGFRAWSVFSSTDPPTRSFPVQGQVVIISEQVSQSLNTVTGTTLKRLPQHVAVKKDTPASSSTGLPTTMLAQVEEKSNAKITALEQRVDTLTAQVADNHKEVTHKVQQVATECQAIESKIGTQLDSMFAKFLQCQNKNFADLESTNKAAITALRDEYQSGYSEIKDLLSNSPKARKVMPAVP